MENYEPLTLCNTQRAKVVPQKDMILCSTYIIFVYRKQQKMSID
jgi:hypothetical protein